MYRIAVCDDDIVTCAHIEEILLQYAKESKIEVDVNLYTSGEDLYRCLKGGNIYDLVFLDIELKLMNGIEVASKIREVLKNESIHIIYISSKSEYALKLFETRPLNFLVKPITGQQIIKSFEKAINLSEKFSREFVFQFGRNTYKLPQSSIEYFMSEAKKIIIATPVKEYEYYDKLSNVMKQLPERDFFFIHKSYIVNYLYVQEYGPDSLTLTSGLELAISQTYRKRVKAYLLKRRLENI